MGELIKTKREFNEWFNYEKKKYGNCKFWRIKSLLKYAETPLLIKHNYLLRKTEWHINSGHKLLSKIYNIRLKSFQNVYGMHIPVNRCGKGLRIMHIGSVIINERANVGDDCVFHINSGVVAGGTNGGCPTLGNNVIVGIGAIVLGGITVADHIAIGANAVVNKDFLEPDIAIAGVPAKKISDNGSSQWNKQRVK